MWFALIEAMFEQEKLTNPEAGWASNFRHSLRAARNCALASLKTMKAPATKDLGAGEPPQPAPKRTVHHQSQRNAPYLEDSASAALSLRAGFFDEARDQVHLTPFTFPYES